ncbi:MAG: nucleotidyltransferase domain-containing protein [Deltaproteobacteria bacterium]|nr:nucleotidyltransferase domain-containing protein [Deltaproteobacteria bacterium]
MIGFFRDGLRRNGVDISRIILFGSRLTGRGSDDSDIDLVVVSDAFDGKDIFARVGMLKDAEVATIKRYMVPLDVIALTPDEYDNGDSLAAAYAKRGEVVG